ncbi:hypothetical protein MMC27_001835 [Xylographa pallens]|nr:hypothetical protein [Xylographa pallens]
MAARRESMPTWLSVYPLAKEIQGWDSEAPIFVDVGGGIGQQCAELLAKYPDLSGRVVLEDLGHCIDQALPTVGVKNVVQDIFTAQQVLGAKYYHLRGVLHDFPDDKCRKILLNIIQALRKGSLVLIEEMVIPNKGVHREATEVDLTMMCGFAAIERTEAQWRSLLDSVGLRILKVHEVLPSIHETLLVAVTR